MTDRLEEIYKKSKFKNKKEFNEWVFKILEYALKVQLEVREDVIL